MMSVFFNTLSRFVIAFLPRGKHLLISWLQSPSTVILEPKKRKSVTASTFSPSICYEVIGPNFFLMLCLKPAFSLSSSILIKKLFSSSSFSGMRYAEYHLHIWDCCYFSWKCWFQLVTHPARHFAWCTLHIS